MCVSLFLRFFSSSGWCSKVLRRLLTVCVTSEVAQSQVSFIYGSYSNGLNALERYQRVFSFIIVIIRCFFLLICGKELVLFFLQLFNIIHLTAGDCMKRVDPDKGCSFYEFNWKHSLNLLSASFAIDDFLHSKWSIRRASNVQRTESTQIVRILNSERYIILSQKYAIEFVTFRKKKSLPKFTKYSLQPTNLLARIRFKRTCLSIYLLYVLMFASWLNAFTRCSWCYASLFFKT